VQPFYALAVRISSPVKRAFNHVVVARSLAVLLRRLELSTRIKVLALIFSIFTNKDGGSRKTDAPQARTFAAMRGIKN
jgi:hypothetical protein